MLLAVDRLVSFHNCKNLCLYVTAGTLAFHVLISLIIFFFFHKGASLKYKKENKTVIIQRVTAFAILILLHIHITAYSHMATGETLTIAQTVLW